MIKYAFLSVVGISNIVPKEPFIGSMIRGCLGYALRKTVCIFPNLECKKCAKTHKCAYYKFYENENELSNFRIDVSLYQKTYDFKIWLFEDGVCFIPYLIVAFEYMQEIGLGHDRRKFTFDKILLNSKVIYENMVLLSKDFSSLTFKPKFQADNVKVILKTPLRIKQDGHIAQSLDLTSFLRSLVRRVYLLKGINKKVDFTPKFSDFKPNLEFYNLQRYSNRQKKKHEIAGLIGEFKIYDLDKTSVELLELASIIGAGKSTALGLGNIQIDII
ncbi:CRISPR system precrRNA processing endoribonuclease RAMP protein Cas6 [Campylobacter geochelonis]|uniref:CRISPR system precrRNA processing endoribonuclease RAMP protein Cas6 n=1 Tax=Campylobacter geochelonis TaxID=1780362 RepID=UPI0007709A9D|nr:CRISPR system precrRNA processing endoribonuclease RAMP protein Cas6 [Campylobacter geochelonis]CZE46276.1 CRISPR-associated endoribonuclease Cas6 [Campylobacter geochelonis]CZE50707.1 CRISPR-associated endoribonuclease Cas6 [Campylobacter geochelonis]